LNLGESLKIDYTVSDISNLGLKQVELWRTQEKDKWPEDPIQTKTLASESGPLSDSFTDSPSAPGKYWYGVHVVDKAGNWNDQKNSNTNGQPSSFEPVEVEVKAVSTAKASSQAPSEEWNRTFGESDDNWGPLAQQTSDGGYIITGSTASYGSGKSDILLLKTDRNGTKLWNKTFGGSEDDASYSVQQKRDGSYIIIGIATYHNSGKYYVLLIKTDSDGNKLWEKTFSRSEDDFYNSFQQTSDGGYIIAGYTGVMESDGSGMHAQLIKTDSNGDMLWDRTIGGTNASVGHSVQQTSDGGYIISGTMEFNGLGFDIFLIKTDNNGNELWNRTFKPLAGLNDLAVGPVRQTNDGGYIITSTMDSRDSGKYVIRLIKTDSNGNMLWDKTFGNTGDCGWPMSIQQTSDGGYMIISSMDPYGSGKRDIWLFKTDSIGDMLWDKTFGGSEDDTGASVQQTSDGGYILAGTTSSFDAEGRDAWLIKVAPG
jgi:hypothetical protein